LGNKKRATDKLIPIALSGGAGDIEATS